MVVLATRVADDVLRLLLNTDEFATADVTYTPIDGTAASTITVALGAVDGDLQIDDSGEADASMRQAVVSRASDGIASPAIKDELTIDSETWAVAAIERQDEDVSVLRIVRRELGERHGRNYYTSTEG